jgi:uncharacterized protein involved in exopolysaccharide biosynthesis
MDTTSDPPSKLFEYLAAARHRRVMLGITFALAALSTVLLAVLLPPRFRSAATILIEQQEMPQDLVRSTVTSYADERVQVIAKRVMTTETLLGIIQRYGLYPKERANDTREALLERMRKDIGLKMISADVIDPRSGRPTTATIAFEVSYTGTSPDAAARVANELTSLYLDENLKTRTQLARDAATFLESEGDRLNRRIGELESQLAQFKDKHLNQLPEMTQMNMQLLDRTDQEVRAQEARQSSLQQQKVFLEAQLAQLKPNSAVFSDTGERIFSTADRLKLARSQLAAARARYGADHPDVLNLQRQVQGLEQAAADKPAEAANLNAAANDLRRNLEKARAELAPLQQRYGPEHPDRVRLEREVGELESQVAGLPPPSAAAALTDKPVPKPDADNPAYVQIEAQLAATIHDLNSVDIQLEKLRAQANEYQRNIRVAPQVEQQYRELTRDYENTRLKYQEVRSKQAEAKTAQDLEADRKGERFTLIEPPLPPQEPVWPNRKLIFAGGLFLSLSLTVGLLWLLERLDSSVRGRLDLLRLTGVPPLALVPYIGTQAEARRLRRRQRIAVGTAIATVLVATLCIHLFYRPLDVLWFSFAHRMGM